MDWKELFKPAILKGAQGYIADNAVKNYQDAAGVISADIEGIDTFHVTVEYDADTIRNIRCTCPFAQKGNPCKHQAAVLLTWEESARNAPSGDEPAAEKQEERPQDTSQAATAEVDQGAQAPEAQKKSEPAAEQEKETAPQDPAISDAEEDTPQQKTIALRDNSAHYRKDGWDIDIHVGKMDVFNFALYQNDIAPIRDVEIENRTGGTIDGLTLKITADFPFFQPYEAPLPPISSGKPIPLSRDPQLNINGHKLAELTEAVKTTVTVELWKDEEMICGCRENMQVLAYDQYQGNYSYRDLLPAFVLPNHPVIAMLMQEASSILKKWGKSPSLEGYQRKDPNRVRELAAAAYGAIQKKNIAYANPPAGFGGMGQRIRTPETVMEQKLGTCMDMTLLYAALLEQIGLHPILTLIDGHIFAGVWLRERSGKEMNSGNIVIEDLEELKKHFGTGADDMTFVECTAMCSGKNVDFEPAEHTAKEDNLSDPKEFECAIDVKLARRAGVKPIASRNRTDGGYQIEVPDLRDGELTKAPHDLGLQLSEPDMDTAGPKIKNKRELWESKLLDFSPRNMLLNLPAKGNVLPIMSAYIDELEDSLADGHEFQLHPVPDWIAGISITISGKEGKESKEKPWLETAIKEYGVFEIADWPLDRKEKIRQDYRNHRLYTFRNDKQLEKDLTALYRTARAAQQENGVSSLYLAVGLLRWFPPEAKKPSYAPLILVPVEMVRKSANQGYALHARDEEPHFNTTLLELLQQQYNLHIPGLDPLPADEHGVNIRKVLTNVRSHLLKVKGWDVIETCVIGSFSFSQFAIWNDLHTCGDLLEKSNVVRSLMKGHIDWDVQQETDAPRSIYLPISVDDTQLQAIRMAASDKTFVLHGPPGTGKSQTITAMIANLMAQGKRVLFVAEKMAALSVVQKRLEELGIGDFCMELHSNKANKKQVLSQLEKALNTPYPLARAGYGALLEESEARRTVLDDYAAHLYEVQKCGLSMHELIDRYLAVADEPKYVPFNPADAASFTAETVRRQIPLIRSLMAAGHAIGDVKEHPLHELNIPTYSAELRFALQEVAEAYEKALDALRDCIPEMAERLGKAPAVHKKDLADYCDLIRMYEDAGRLNFEGVEQLTGDLSAVFALLEKKEQTEKEQQDFAQAYDPRMLTADLEAIRGRHEAVAKKFFGKQAAMKAVTDEVQALCKTPVQYGDIPAILTNVRQYRANQTAYDAEVSALSERDRQLFAAYPEKQALEAAAEAAGRANAAVADFPGGMEAVNRLLHEPDTERIFAAYSVRYEAMLQAEAEVNRLVPREGRSDDEITLDGEAAFCRLLAGSRSMIKDWSQYCRAKADCMEAGLAPVVEAYEQKTVPGDLIRAYQKGLYYALINYVMRKDDVLSCFSGASFNESIRQFKAMDDELMKKAKKEIYFRLILGKPSATDSAEIGKELNLLRKAIGSSRGLSIRELFARIPHVLQKLCPCMLMSPNSVAQYLAQDSTLFDVVIFDEASQLPTCKAIGALSRAANAVIVGDPKQMPPTAFFAGAGPQTADFALDDLDSILDDALALGIPSQHLQWHYRSTHESLIAFSNHAFYGNKMYTFPSANDRERHVSAVRVAGEYHNGTNPKEAEAIVMEIVRRFRDPELNRQSIGVVTFNIRQKDMIEDLLAKQYQQNQALDIWAHNPEAPLFVKNLENVQGDERDVILFSVGFGPDEKKHISMNFGPITHAGGEKRLNVAFSRARVSMVIFESMTSADIKVGPTTPVGTVAFRDFLKFAEGQELTTEASEENREVIGDGIVSSICDVIQEAGFQTVTGIGHSDFRVDIAVVDPYDPNRYMLGILLDGDTYRDTHNTRDREVSQITVLRRLGWQLHRIWTMDWWDNRRKETMLLRDKLDEQKAEAQKRDELRKAEEEKRRAEQARLAEEEERLKAELEKQAAEVVEEDAAENGSESPEQEPAVQETPPEESSGEDTLADTPAVTAAPTEQSVELPNEPTIVQAPERAPAAASAAEIPESSDDGMPTGVAEYSYANLPIKPSGIDELLTRAGKKDIAERTRSIALIEGPIEEGLLMQRLRISFGIGKLSSAAQSAITAGIQAAKLKATRQNGVVFYWAPEQDAKSYSAFRTAGDRSGEQICQREYQNAAVAVLQKNKQLDQDVLVKEISLQFGYKRLGKNLETIISAAVAAAKKSGMIIYDKSGVYRLP